RHISAESVLFTGCSFPSFYPKTTLKLISLLKERAHMGVVLDCCGKPIWELGMTKEYEKIKASISQKLKKRAVTEIVVICPNCYYFLKENLDIPVISIYEKLKQLNFENRISCEEMNLFIPCPDKKSREIKSDFLPLVKGNIKEIKGIQCCGLGGEASPLEGKIAEEFSVKLKAENFPAIYTYCASCSGNLNRSGCKNVKHILTELLNTHETLPKGLTPLINRGKFKFL
ncbi:MAG: (Fe-S)-binding protein, partial [Oscillospiraceae bacterium]